MIYYYTLLISVEDFETGGKESEVSVWCNEHGWSTSHPSTQAKEEG